MWPQKKLAFKGKALFWCAENAQWIGQRRFCFQVKICSENRFCFSVVFNPHCKWNLEFTPNHLWICSCVNRAFTCSHALLSRDAWLSQLGMVHKDSSANQDRVPGVQWGARIKRPISRKLLTSTWFSQPITGEKRLKRSLTNKDAFGFQSWMEANWPAIVSKLSANGRGEKAKDHWPIGKTLFGWRQSWVGDGNLLWRGEWFFLLILIERQRHHEAKTSAILCTCQKLNKTLENRQLPFANRKKWNRSFRFNWPKRISLGILLRVFGRVRIGLSFRVQKLPVCRTLWKQRKQVNRREWNTPRTVA